MTTLLKMEITLYVLILSYLYFDEFKNGPFLNITETTCHLIGRMINLKFPCIMIIVWDWSRKLLNFS